jgi:hypothetical protein
MSERKIAYEKHPVSPERKAALRAQGYKIIDARFAPAEQEAEAERSEDAAADQADAMASLRVEYERALGKKPFMGWDAETLKAKIADAGA